MILLILAQVDFVGTKRVRDEAAKIQFALAFYESFSGFIEAFALAKRHDIPLLFYEL